MGQRRQHWEVGATRHRGSTVVGCPGWRHPSEMSSTDLLLVDDDAAFRSTARALLTSAGFSVLAEAATGSDALATAAAISPALVLLDVQLPDIDGFEVARRLRAQSRPPAVVLISTREAID